MVGSRIGRRKASGLSAMSQLSRFGSSVGPLWNSDRPAVVRCRSSPGSGEPEDLLGPPHIVDGHDQLVLVDRSIDREHIDPFAAQPAQDRC